MAKPRKSKTRKFAGLMGCLPFLLQNIGFAGLVAWFLGMFEPHYASTRQALGGSPGVDYFLVIIGAFAITFFLRALGRSFRPDVDMSD